MPAKKSAWKEAEEYGIDVKHLEYIMQKDYSQRFREHQNASNFVDELSKAGKNYYEKLRRNN